MFWVSQNARCDTEVENSILKDNLHKTSLEARIQD
jgi:hypothetical protein